MVTLSSSRKLCRTWHHAVFRRRLPRFHRADPSTALDKSDAYSVVKCSAERVTRERGGVKKIVLLNPHPRPFSLRAEWATGDFLVPLREHSIHDSVAYCARCRPTMELCRSAARVLSAMLSLIRLRFPHRGCRLALNLSRCPDVSITFPLRNGRLVSILSLVRLVALSGSAKTSGAGDLSRRIYCRPISIGCKATASTLFSPPWGKGVRGEGCFASVSECRSPQQKRWLRDSRHRRGARRPCPGRSSAHASGGVRPQACHPPR